MQAALLRLFQYVFLAWLYVFLVRMVATMRDDIRALERQKAVERAGVPVAARQPGEEEFPRLAVKVGAGTAPAGHEYTLLPVTTAGSGADNHVCVLGGNLAARHFRLILKNGSFWCEDLSGEPGTYINGYRVGGQVELAAGDEIRAGEVTFVFRG